MDCTLRKTTASSYIPPNDIIAQSSYFPPNDLITQNALIEPERFMDPSSTPTTAIMAKPLEDRSSISLERTADYINDFSNIFNDDIDVECFDTLCKPFESEHLNEDYISNDVEDAALIDEFCLCLDVCEEKEKLHVNCLPIKEETQLAAASAKTKSGTGRRLVIPPAPTNGSMAAPLPSGYMTSPVSCSLGGGLSASKAMYRKTVAIPRYLAKRKKRKWGKSKAMYDTRTEAANKRARRNGRFSRSAVFVSVTDFC